MMAAALSVATGVALVVIFRAPDQPAAVLPASAVEETTAVPIHPESYERFDRPAPKREPQSKPESETPANPDPEPEAEPTPNPEPEPRQDALAAGEPAFSSLPDEAELARLDEPRRFAPDPNAGLTLTVPSLGVQGAPVYDSDSESALADGISHVPETSMPWTRSPHRNVYLAAHRIGYPGSGSRLMFYELDQLRRGDEVILKGRGKTYRYRVSEILVVDWNESWVMGQVVGRDMVSLQTCTPIPTFEKRLVVRADRI